LAKILQLKSFSNAMYKFKAFIDCLVLIFKSFGLALLNFLYNKEKKNYWLANAGDVIVVTYSSTISQAKYADHDPYWGDFLLRGFKETEKINIIQIPIDNMFAQIFCPCSQYKKHKINSINLFHFLDIAICIKSITSQIKLWIRAFNIRQAIQKIEFENYRYHNIFNGEVFKSLFTDYAFKGILYYHLFDKILGSVKLQRAGFYLSEFQNWETAFCQNWYKHRHKNLFAYIHAGLRFWDLRYYFSPQTLKSKNANCFPKKFLVHSKDDYIALKESGIKLSKILKVEPLRFLNMYKLIDKRLKKENNSKKNIGVFLDYSQTTSIKIIDCIAAACKNKYNLIVKKHPANVKFKHTINNCHISFETNTKNILNQASIIICPIASSISLQLLKTKKKILYFCAAAGINLGFETNEKNISVFCNAESLNQHLTNISNIKNKLKHKFFFSKKNKLKKWQQITH